MWKRLFGDNWAYFSWGYINPRIWNCWTWSWSQKRRAWPRGEPVTLESTGLWGLARSSVTDNTRHSVSTKHSKSRVQKSLYMMTHLPFSAQGLFFLSGAWIRGSFFSFSSTYSLILEQRRTRQSPVPRVHEGNQDK